MEDSSEDNIKTINKKRNLSKWILSYDKNSYCDSKIKEENRNFLIDSFNDSSEKRKSFHGSLKKLCSSFDFPRVSDPLKFERSYTITTYPKFELRKLYHYDKDLKLFKNN